jgi:small subunit ribosomal protein S17
MADENENENVEETTPAAEAEAPEAADASDATDAPEAEAAAPATDGAGDDAAPAAAAAPASPREQRRQARAAKAAAAAGSRPQRTPEERQAERDAARKARASARRVHRAKLREKAKAAHAAAPGEPTPRREHGEGRQKVRQGVVVSDKADKTITVRIDTARQHRRYHKIVRSSTTLHAHDERNDAHIGDTVIVRESRPLSRLKRWRLIEVVERAR